MIERYIMSQYAVSSWGSWDKTSKTVPEILT